MIATIHTYSGNTTTCTQTPQPYTPNAHPSHATPHPSTCSCESLQQVRVTPSPQRRPSQVADLIGERCAALITAHNRNVMDAQRARVGLPPILAALILFHCFHQSCNLLHYMSWHQISVTPSKMLYYTLRSQVIVNVPKNNRPGRNRFFSNYPLIEG